MKRLFLMSVFLLYVIILTAQPFNYIGLTRQEILKHMQKNNPGFDLDEGAVNTMYKYIKFVDKYYEETLLCFLDENNICTHTKLMSDYSNLKWRTDELNKTCKNAGENKWVFVDKGNIYMIELKKEEWFFTIITKKKK